MDLIQLKYFLKVVEHRSFTKAAESLFVAQPAITRQVQALEDELGVRLLHRHSRGAEPTEAGHKLVAGAEAIYRLLEQTKADVAASTSVVSGNLRIGFPSSISDLIVGSTAAVYREQHPCVTLSLVEGYTASLRDALLQDRLDMAILSGEDASPLITTHLIFDEALWLVEPRGTEPPTLRGAADSGHPAPYAFAELASRRLIQPGRANTMRQVIEAKAAKADVHLQIVIEAEGLHLIKSLVRKGAGCHVSPYSGLIEDIERGEFSGAPITGLRVSRFLAYRTDRPHSQAFLRFRDLLYRRVQEVAAKSPAGAMTLSTELNDLVTGLDSLDH